MTNIRKDLLQVKTMIDELLKFEDKSLLKFSEDVKGAEECIRSAKKFYKSIHLHGKKAKVKVNTRWIYAGHTFPIQEVYMWESGKYGGYKRDSLHLRLDLRGTVFEYRDNAKNPDKPYRSTSTVINTEDLIIID